MQYRNLWLVGAVLAAPLALPADDADLFTSLDADKDGFLTKTEVPADRQRLFERLLRSNDKNSDGKLSREEFTAKAEEPRDAAPERTPDVDPAEIFKRLDRDGDGKLTKDEAPERIKENFDRIDLNSDGSIALAEFREVSARLGAAAGRPGADSGREAQAIFERLDANKDGKVAADEVPEDRREGFLRAITRIDSDGDKAVTKEEFAKVYAIMRGGADPTTRPDARPAASGGPVPLIRLLDADGNGEISAEELANASKALLKLDRNGDGKLTREELQPPPAGGPEGGPRPEQIIRRLKQADRNGDGKIQKDEAPPGIAAIFERADRNSDGELDEAELKAAIERLSQRGEGGDRPREQPKPRD